MVDTDNADAKDRFNLEIKVYDHHRERTRSLLQDQGAVFLLTVHQQDSFLRSPQGQRLKIRRESLGKTQVIRYFRPDTKAPSVSSYSITEITEGDSEFEAWFDQQEVVCTVDKTRSVYLVENIRIHLDEVDGLGNFVEFEAVSETRQDAENCRQKLWDLLSSLQLRECDLQSHSYADLLRTN